MASNISMSTQFHFTAIILAAGTSSRMGTPKQLLEVNGLSLLDHAIQAALNAGIISPIVVLGANAKLIEDQSVLLSHCTTVLNPKFVMGQSTSLVQGVLSSPAKSNAYIFLLADQPFIEGQMIGKMMSTFEKTGADVLYPEYRGQRGNPVIISSRLRQQLLLATGDNGARFLFSDRSLKIVSYPVSTEAVTIDIDTPSDYQKFCNHALFQKIRSIE